MNNVPYLALLLTCASSLTQAQSSLEMTAPFRPLETQQAKPQIEINDFNEHQTFAIVAGDNQIALHPKNLLRQNITIARQPKPVVSVSYWGANESGYGWPFPGGDEQVIRNNAKELVIQKSFHDGSTGESAGNFTQTITLLEDGQIESSYQYTLPAGAKQPDDGLIFRFEESLASGMPVEIDGVNYQITAAASSTNEAPLFRGPAKRIVFWPEKPTQRFSIEFTQTVDLFLRERINALRPDRQDIEMRATPDRNGSIAYKLDIRNTSAASMQTDDTFANINFWKNDRLHIPDFEASRNRLPNPSFESGLRYFNLYPIWGTWPGRDLPLYTLDSTQGLFGNQSLKVSAWKDYERPNYLSTFTLPTEPGKSYTFSFYAKALAPGQRMQLFCVSGQWGDFPKLSNNSIKLTQEWTRYSTTFTAPNRAASMLFKIQNTSTEMETATLIDALQFEEGEQPSEFIDTTLGSDLITANPDNFLQPDEAFDTRLVISGPSNAKGQVSYTLEDLYYQNVASGTLDFTTDTEGRSTIDLPIDASIGEGIFVLRCDYTLEDASYTDFYRLSCLQALTKPFKHRPLFSGPAVTRINRSEAVAERFSAIGYGSSSYQSDPIANDLYHQHHITSTGSGVFGYGPKGTGELAQARRQVWERLESEPYSNELAEQVEAVAYQMVQAYPWIETWFLHGECNGGGGKLEVVRKRDYEGFAKFIIACARGILRADPEKRLMLTGGPTNMSPSGGILYLRNTIQQVNQLAPDLKFDAIAAHPYRPVPENPDLDADATTFIKMLEQHGYGDTPIYWNEGIYNNPWQIAEWGLDPHKGCSTDHWRCGTPTYDMGWGERISAAYYARSWLVGLKYADRVAQYDGWVGSFQTMDTRLTPVLSQKIPHTLGTLLGEASYVQDVRFAPESRVYVFEDAQQRPVAAMWSYMPMVDRGYEASPIATIEFGTQRPEVINLMGNSVQLNFDKSGSIQIPVSPFPVFIRGEAGQTAALIQSMEQAKLSGAQQSAIALNYRVTQADELKVTLTNRLSQPYQGSITIPSIQPADSFPLELAGLASTQRSIQLPNPLKAEQMNDVSLSILLTEADGTSSEQAVTFEALPILRRDHFQIDGELNDWNEIPAIPLSNAIQVKPSAPVDTTREFEASYRVAWNESHLYLCVEVKDSEPHFPPTQTPSSIWTIDSLQVYLDTFGDNAERTVNQRFDFNDYEYDISKNQETDELIVYRRIAPEQQLAGGLDAPRPDTVEPDIDAAIRMTDKGYTYEVAFPRRLVAPLPLESAGSFRMGLTLNNGSSEGRQSNLNNLSVVGKDPYNAPEAWPIMLPVRAPATK
ncbi:sugar-binding protein [Coraliomargarita algicola]|uniref:Sugar-binding protein n=1 Tax=Coraliomargarita algicola TaxID=3092156 RepID=A0ABZ0RPS6_9BACT|nr:sugar-binding protein [Coraliomargarita sp. J2-16]WPJ97239.1 sugar-binding protein [Coraliomargarita sp. J2-16]